MEKLKLIVAIGLCVALILFPLSGMAENPNEDQNNDGHPWDDGSSGGGTTNSGDDPGEEPQDETVEIGKDEEAAKCGKPARAYISVALTKHWFLLLLW